MTLADFPAARYRFTFEMEQVLQLPFYSGSLFRGVFGRALRQLACMTRARTCEGCPVKGQCHYAQIFDLQDASLPYVLIPPPITVRTIEPGMPVNIEMTLIGPALDRLAIIIMAWQRAFYSGIGKSRCRGHLRHVSVITHDGDSMVYNATDSEHGIMKHKPVIPFQISHHIERISITSPMRIKAHGKVLGPDRLDLERLLIALRRRIGSLCSLYAPSTLLPDVPSLLNNIRETGVEHDLRWVRWKRFSSRQQKEMSFGGVMGDYHLSIDDREIITLLTLAQWVNLGAKSSFGMGQVAVD